MWSVVHVVRPPDDVANLAILPLSPKFRSDHLILGLTDAVDLDLGKAPVPLWQPSSQTRRFLKNGWQETRIFENWLAALGPNTGVFLLSLSVALFDRKQLHPG